MIKGIFYFIQTWYKNGTNAITSQNKRRNDVSHIYDYGHIQAPPNTTTTTILINIDMAMHVTVHLMLMNCQD